ncbi:hypothetical protein [Leptospira kirschneri]|uniref:hypothetical protein n=1 Tax=Leptospira kirschneri TaxID=29507 RepID=UPI00046C6AA6|nr:hypothetical protein [Leptospira kirschneri]
MVHSEKTQCKDRRGGTQCHDSLRIVAEGTQCHDSLRIVAEGTQCHDSLRIVAAGIDGFTTRWS